MYKLKLRKNKRKIGFIMCFLLCMVFALYEPSVIHAYTEDTSTSPGKTKGGFEYAIHTDNTITITGYSGTSTDVTIPDKIDGMTVTEIGNRAFYLNDLVTVTIPGTVTIIGEKAFSYCDKLQTVTFTEDGLKTIGERAFEVCNLSGFDFPKTLTKVGDRAFLSAKWENLILPANVTDWGESVFNASSFTNVIYEDGASPLGANMFSDCNITNFLISSNISAVNRSDDVFSSSHIKKIVVKDGVTKLGAGILKGAEIESITIPVSVKSMSDALPYNGVVKIICSQGSTAYNYAKKNAITVKLVGARISPTTKTVYVGDKVTLKVVNATKKVTWNSSNDNIASVTSKGVVTTKKNGTVKITAVHEGLSLVCTVTVKKMSLNTTSTTITVGHYAKLKVTGSSGKAITWRSTNKKIATVTAKGTVKGIKAGATKITAICKGKKYTCTVHIRSNQKSFPLYTQYSEPNKLSAGVSKIKYDSSGMTVTILLVNNSIHKATELNFTLVISNASGVVAKQDFRKQKVSVDAHSKKYMTVKIKASNIKNKKVDLRTESITSNIQNATYYYVYSS